MQTAVTIENDTELQRVLDRISSLMDAPADSPEDAELIELVEVSQEYQRGRFDIGKPDPAAVIEYALDSGRASLPDMIDIFGSRAALVDFITRKTPMDADTAATISKRYHYSVERLTAPFDGEQGWYDVLPGDEPWRQELKDATAGADAIADRAALT